MAKNRRKKRRKKRSQAPAAPPRPNRVAPEARPDVVAARPSGPGSEGTVVGTVVEVEREILWIEVGGVQSMLYASELMLGIGERPADRYAVGDHFEAVVFQMDPDPESGAAQFSIRRVSPYPEALAALDLRTEVQATVVNTYDAGIELEIDGVRGNAYSDELPLQSSESPHQRYKPSETIKSVLVWGLDQEARHLALSVKRSAPGYLEALQRRAIGDVVSGTVTVLANNGGLWLDVDGLVGWVAPEELDLADGESAQERYAVGQTIEDLFVWQINHETRDLRLSVKRNAPGYVEALQRRAIGDVVSGTVTVLANNGGLWLDVDGLVGWVAPEELDLADGESAQERYAVGQTIEDLFVWQINHETRDLRLSVKRNAPGYVEALQRRTVGEVVSGTITALASDGGLWLDVDGLVGWGAPDELDLADGESARERYAVGQTIEDLFVWDIDHEARILDLSVKRNAPGYMEVLQRRAIGNVVSGTITSVGESLWLDVDSLVGNVAPDELVLNEGESARERYAADETIDGLLVWQVNHEDRDLDLSVKRNTPKYVRDLQRRAVGDVVSGTITGFEGSGGLLLDVDGLVGSVPPWEIALADGESAQNRYADGETIDGLFVWQVNYETRDLFLSATRNTPGYVEALQRRAVGEVLSATVTGITPGGLWLDVQGAIGWIFKKEALLEDGEELAEHYSVGDSVTAVVRHIDRASRTVLLSAQQIPSTLIEEPIVFGVTIKVMVVRKRDGGIDVSVGGGSEVGIPDYALSLRPGGSPDLEMGQEIDVVAMGVEDRVPTVLSYRRAMDGWETARDRLAAGVVVPDARVIPWRARPNRDDGRAAVDLGPITGFISLDERDAEAAEDLMSLRANTRLGVVIEALNKEVWTASVSEAKFEARWRELVDGLPTGEGIEGEIVDIARGVATLDLGFGLLGELPVNGDERIGEVVTVGIRSVDREEYRIAVEIKNYDLMQMIAADETLICELKKVFLASVQPESPSARRNRQDVNRSVVRAMAGMMNRNGGHVIVGVEDTDKKDGDVVGWEASGWENQNAMATALSELVSDLLGPTAGGLCTPRFELLPGGHEVLDIVCQRADEPIFLSGGQREEFPVRFPAMTKNLTARDQHEYIQGRFYGQGAGG